MLLLKVTASLGMFSRLSRAALLLPLVTVKTGTTEEDKDRMKKVLSARLLDGCRRTPEGSSYALDLFFLHVQKRPKM